ncbi:MAG: type III pantothenate kinase [Muribaculaceae bacterium]|nr:type III pantothenate kinase [Muribaculaceae bacterium]
MMREHRRILVLDRGNTRLKASLFEEATLLLTKVITSEGLSELAAIVDFNSLEGAIWCSVGPEKDPLLDYLHSLLGSRLKILTSATALPFEVRYGTRATLGVDRVAAVAGAVSLWPGQQLVVADAGTALTIDMVSQPLDEPPVFLGGNISPGINMRLRSLHEHTARLPLVTPGGELPVWGHDTVTALRCGAVRGAAAEIKVIRDKFEVQTQCPVRIVLTGGDAALLASALDDCLLLSQETELVAYGLLSIYEYTENNE